MPSIDLNADLAEGDALSASDVALLEVVSSASLACGFHAGGASVMRAASEACVSKGVAIGAHVSYRDRDGFGRRDLDVAPDRLAADVAEQWDTLEEEARAAGGTVAYVKPHGALYHRLSVDLDAATAVVDALASRCRVLVAPPGAVTWTAARSVGARVVAEGFCDRAYETAGGLVPRHRDGAVLDDPAAVAEQARSLVLDGGVVSVTGGWVPLAVGTICLHGDRPGAEAGARRVRDVLAAAGVRVRSFTGPGSGATG